MTNKNMTYRSYDISDDLWEVLAPHLPGKKGSVGRPSHNNRSFLNGVMWVFRNGSVWRDLPEEYGNWNSFHKRYIRWRKKGIWDSLILLGCFRRVLSI